jgi:hypothetical protein
MENREMRPLATSMLLAALLPSLAWIPSAGAQAVRPVENLTYAQAERRAIDLKQGMTPDEVQQLLGKPKRTALRSSSGYSGTAESQGTLQWTYGWSSASQSERNLQVTFVSKSPDQWLVNGWDWSGY